ncbi:lysophospholipid acyltransferase family protein [Yinghuangia soli]|uniref:1-acyl-sn-glycerol-3-phosphate acyltransferase n=1 Tax=Yinghuangia soli TaxID=2908204 RepID=A0AA41Q6H7_9ACTN|nr:lysophospholipid acyltransferase family protein [Yinghuangia soli]MCF2531249.1 1-acyl-sn-glycerol-3-phosphate acyltransferase [Yinghuangia soli]
MFYRLMKAIIAPLLRLFFRPEVEGRENIPERGPAILASNHLSFSDSFFLPAMVPRRVTFLAKSDYFTGRGIKGRLTAAFFRGAGQVPVDRTGGTASEAALNAGLKVLGHQALLGIYPEGTRSPDGRLYRGKTGIARMALESGAPVIPVVMIDTEKIQPPGKVIPKVMRVGIKIGEPLDFSRYEGMEDDRFILRSITDEIMYALMELSGQEYVDVYAADAKKAITEARKLAAAADKAAKAEAAAKAKVEAESAAKPAAKPAEDTTGGTPESGTKSG